MSILRSELRVGSRKSPLALEQAAIAMKTLQAGLGGAYKMINIYTFTTSGDKVSDRPLYEIGGKALFAKELEEALLDKHIDVAVHSLKDVESFLPPGLVLAAYLKRADPRDVLIMPDRERQQASDVDGTVLNLLPIGARVGTVSPRRKLQLHQHRLDLEVVPLRGNINTRSAKLKEGQIDALILAAAGLQRLNLWEDHMHILPPEEMLPAAGQGVIALQCREDDHELIAFLQAFNHLETAQCVKAERTLLQHLGGSCRTPIAAYATCLEAREISLRAMLGEEEGNRAVFAAAQGRDEMDLAKDLAHVLQTNIQAK